MLRAATLGAIDFARFDPWDARSWRRVQAILNEIGRQNNQEALLVRQRHWLALVATPQLTEESWENVKASAETVMTDLLCGYFPWRAKEISEAGAKTSRDSAVEQFHELYGRPGEPRYEQMMQEWGAYLAKGKLSQREKDLERKQRRERAQQQAALATAG